MAGFRRPSSDSYQENVLMLQSYDHQRRVQMASDMNNAREGLLNLASSHVGHQHATHRFMSSTSISDLHLLKQLLITDGTFRSLYYLQLHLKQTLHGL